MKILLFALMFVLGISTASGSHADTSLDEAVACFDKMLADARGGASLSHMVESYVSVTSLASRAVSVQKRLDWSTLTADEQATYKKAVNDYFTTEAVKAAKGIGKNDFVQLDTVELRPRQHKAVKGGWQLSGAYKSYGGSSENFALFIGKHKGRCYVYDARWRDAWLSKFVTLP
jgi:hypothetical protein